MFGLSWYANYKQTKSVSLFHGLQVCLGGAFHRNDFEFYTSSIEQYRCDMCCYDRTHNSESLAFATDYLERQLALEAQARTKAGTTVCSSLT